MTGKIHSHYSLTRMVTNEAAVKKVRGSLAGSIPSPIDCIRKASYAQWSQWRQRKLLVFLMCSRICDYRAHENVLICLSLLTGNLSDNTDFHAFVNVINLNPGSILKENMDNDSAELNSRWQTH